MGKTDKAETDKTGKKPRAAKKRTLLEVKANALSLSLEDQATLILDLKENVKNKVTEHVSVAEEMQKILQNL